MPNKFSDLSPFLVRDIAYTNLDLFGLALVRRLLAMARQARARAGLGIETSIKDENGTKPSVDPALFQLPGQGAAVHP